MQSDLINVFATDMILSAAIVFSRIGTILILVPGMGDARIPQRARIAMALIVTIAMIPMVPNVPTPDRMSVLAALIAFEVTIGLFIATCVRLFFSAVHILGAQVSYSSGLANAISPNDGNFESASSLSSLLYMGSLAVFFATDTHHLVFQAALRSYQAIPIGQLPAMDMAQQIARIGGDIIYMAVYFGAPFFLFSVLFNLALGLSNRVMPAMQVFFVAAPAMILFGLSILAIAAPMILASLNTEIATWLQELVR